MDYTIIEVPDMNDSVSRIVLDGKPYHIRFTYNMAGDFWTFGLYDTLDNPLMIGVKVVPNFPLNLFLLNEDIPYGVFAATTKNDRITRRDFVEKNAQFIFCPVQ